MKKRSKIRSIKTGFRKRRKRTWDETQEVENPRLRDAILEIVENQLGNNEPPETRETFQRLLEESYTEEEAKKLIGCVVSSEIFDILQAQKEFNRNRYIQALNRLPDLPWEE